MGQVMTHFPSTGIATGRVYLFFPLTHLFLMRNLSSAFFLHFALMFLSCLGICLAHVGCCWLKGTYPFLFTGLL